MSVGGGDGERRGVLCVGTVVVDACKIIDAYPVIERLSFIERVSLSTGGPGLNLAMDLRGLGVSYPVGVVGAVGDDEYGRYLHRECERAGIEASRLVTMPGAMTSFTDAMVERDGGRRTFFHHIGANDLLALDGLDLSAERARILHCGAPGLHRLLDAPREGGNGWSVLLSRARAAGLHTNLEMVTLEPRRQRSLVLPCLPHLDSVVVNEIEAGALTGVDAVVPSPDGPVDWPALEAMAGGLVARGVQRLAVVHFPAGCVAAASDGRVFRQGAVRLPRDQVVSTIGAGDAFAAGVIYGVHDGWPVEDCLRLGAASAASCVLSPATSGVAPAAEALTSAEATGFRPTR